MTPSDWSPGVLGTLPVTSRSPVNRAASVNVPPTSTPRTTNVFYPRNTGDGPKAAPAALSLHPRSQRQSLPLRLAGRRCKLLRRGDLQVLLEVLVRRAVLAAWQRHALA